MVSHLSVFVWPLMPCHQQLVSVMSNWSNNTIHIELSLQYCGELQEGNVETAGSRHPSVRHQRVSFLPEVERRLLKLATFQQSARRQISVSSRKQAETQGYYECGECALTTRISHLTLISKLTLFDSTLSSLFRCLIVWWNVWVVWCRYVEAADVESKQSSDSHCQPEGLVQ